MKMMPSGKGQDGGGRSMGGCNKDHDNMTKAQGAKRVTPGDFARNNMSKGGVNKDLGGGKKR